MDPFPTQVDLDAEPDTLGQGHRWIREVIEGIALRFSLQSDGRLVFGDETRRYEVGSEPLAVRPAITTVQSGFRRDAFRDAVADVGAVTFYGVATCQHRINYDWERLPAFVGYDVRSPERGGLFPPDAAHASFERLGLTPAPALAREVRADAFDPDRYEFPPSEWAGAPVAGVTLADKHGWRGRLPNPDTGDDRAPSFETVTEAAELLVSDLATERDIDTVLEGIARRNRADLEMAGIDPSSGAFRSAVAEAVQRRR